MKGIVFTEFVEMIEKEFGIEMADDLLMQSDLPSGGAYTAVGNYDHQEMLKMVALLSQKTGLPAPDLARAFGKYLFQRFTTLYARFFENVSDAFDMLARIDSYIHMEVRKLYHDAELPRVLTETAPDGTLTLTYSSARPFADVAEGLIRGCVTHFGESVEITRRVDEPTDARHAIFVLRRTLAPASVHAPRP